MAPLTLERVVRRKREARERKKGEAIAGMELLRFESDEEVRERREGMVSFIG